MNLSQRQLQAFLEVARLASFTRAAERLHITQSGLSAMMRDLEAQLDCRLFDRTTRSVVLTAAGHQLAPVAMRVLAELDSVSDSLNQIATRAQRLLTVGATPVIADAVMPLAYAAFSQRQPQISLRIRDIGRQQIQEGVESGELDAGFGAFFKPASGIERIALGEFALAYVGPADRGGHGRRNRKMKWSDLRDEPLIGLPPANPVQELIERQLKQIGRSDEARPVYENFHTILAMVEAGYGVAILPSFIAPACRRYRIALSILTEPTVRLNFYQITRKGSITTAAMADLADAVRHTFQAHGLR
jgi:DNA-binding transcriptional LysR family regulator